MRIDAECALLSLSAAQAAQKFALEVMLLTYTHDEVKQVVGEHAVWQQMPIDKAFKYLNLTVRAGSMSKPNKFKDREQWMQLLPVLQQGVQQIAQFTAAQAA